MNAPGRGSPGGPQPSHDLSVGPDFLLDCLDWPAAAAMTVAMFNRYGDLPVV